MKKIWHVIIVLLLNQLIYSTALAATPLVEFIVKPNANQSLKPQNTGLLFYTLRNNTSTTFPLSYSFSSSLATVSPISNTCGNAIAANSTCVFTVQYQAPANNLRERLIIRVYYQGRAPLLDAINFNIDSTIACVLINTASYQTPFCQDQYQKVIEYTPNVFNTSNQNVLEEQTLGGVVGIFRNINNVEHFCYVGCGLRALGGSMPNGDTLFELASVTKTFTGSILGKLVTNGTLPSPNLAVAPHLPAGFMLNPNENPVTFQQLATFSGGVCYSDAPGIIQNPGTQIQNQNAFITDINGLNPDPASGNCFGGGANSVPIYATPPYLPTKNFYSNSSFGLLGQALMTIDGFGVLEPGFNDWMCQQITNVLNMTKTNGCLPAEAQNGTCGASTSTCLFTTDWTSAEYSEGYHITTGKQYESGSPFPFFPWAPAGGIRSNAVDMLKYIRANLGFATNNTQLALITGMLFAHQPNDYLPAPGLPIPNIGSQNPFRGGQGYAWVCMPSPTNGDRICGKIGGHPNFRSFLGFNKNQNYGLVILFNTGAISTNGSLHTGSVPTVGQIGASLLEHVS